MVWPPKDTRKRVRKKQNEELRKAGMGLRRPPKAVRGGARRLLPLFGSAARTDALSSDQADPSGQHPFRNPLKADENGGERRNDANASGHHCLPRLHALVRNTSRVTVAQGAPRVGRKQTLAHTQPQSLRRSMRLANRRASVPTGKRDDGRGMRRRAEKFDLQGRRAVHVAPLLDFLHFSPSLLLRRTFVRIYNRTNKGSCQQEFKTFVRLRERTGHVRESDETSAGSARLH